MIDMCFISQKLKTKIVLVMIHAFMAYESYFFLIIY